MTTMSVSAGQPFTVTDLEAIPDDGRRYELVDGELLVSPAPGLAHQLMVLELAVLLRAACPDDMQVLTGPFAVRPMVCTELQPDVLVARIAELTETHLPTAPVLAVEIASTSTRLVDVNLKRAVYERMGVPAYWLIEPDPPALTVLELRDGAYHEVAAVAGDDPFDATTPFGVRVVPGSLLGRLRR